MFENPRRGRQTRNFTTNVPKILDLKSASEQIFSENWRWVPLFHSRGTKPAYWDAKVALGQDQQKAYIILNGDFLCFSCPSAAFASQYAGFVPREWKPAKSLFFTENRSQCWSLCELGTACVLTVAIWRLNILQISSSNPYKGKTLEGKIYGGPQL